MPSHLLDEINSLDSIVTTARQQRRFLAQLREKLGRKFDKEILEVESKVKDGRVKAYIVLGPYYDNPSFQMARGRMETLIGSKFHPGDYEHSHTAELKGGDVTVNSRP